MGVDSTTDRANAGGEGPPPVTPAGPPRANVWQMFDRIAGRYDLLNRLLSLRRDVAWRRRMGKYVPGNEQVWLLDVATGTADVMVALLKRRRNLSGAVGIDMAPSMLRLAAEKIRTSNLDDRASLLRADAESLPFADGTFDVVTIAFGIRNMSDTQRALREMYRVLVPDGVAIILEFSLPRNWLVRRLYPFHLRGLVPRLGAWLSGDSRAYRYLNETVESFSYGEEFVHVMKQVGFSNVQIEPLTFGIASLYRGLKQDEG